MSTSVTLEALEALRDEFVPLVGLRLDWLSLPQQALPGFEPSQVAVIVNTLIDAALPQIELLATTLENRLRLQLVGLSKHPGILGQREGYPDYLHKSGYRVELKGLFVDNAALQLKRPPTRREPSARLKENVTVAQIEADKDVLMLAAVQLQEETGVCRPVVIEIGLFPMIECIEARDKRLLAAGGRWHHGLAQVVKKTSMSKYRSGSPLADSDFEKDTNFGKLKRIPYAPLQSFMRKHGILGESDPKTVAVGDTTMGEIERTLDKP